MAGRSSAKKAAENRNARANYVLGLLGGVALTPPQASKEAMQYYARAELVANVPPNYFMPRPGVGSAVIRLTKYQTPPVQPKDPDLMFRLIRASFNQRRKTLQNGLNNSPDVPCSREAIAAAIEKLGLPAAVRGETLSLKQFADLADCLSDT